MNFEDNCVRVVDGDAEAQQVKSFLAAHKIPCHFEGEALRTVHGFTLNGLGVVRICVPGPLVEKAKELLARADAGELQLPDHPEIEPECPPGLDCGRGGVMNVSSRTRGRTGFDGKEEARVARRGPYPR